MNIIIQKLNLPKDVKHEISHFFYDSSGYTFLELLEIEKLKRNKKQKFDMLRLKVELYTWKRSLYNQVCWLKGGGIYKGPFFQRTMHIHPLQCEFMSFVDAHLKGFITDKELHCFYVRNWIDL